MTVHIKPSTHRQAQDTVSVETTIPIIVAKELISSNTKFCIDSPAILSNTSDAIIAKYSSGISTCNITPDGKVTVKVEPKEYLIKTDKKSPAKLGLMMVGWGGNNGSTLTAALLANRKKLTWQTRNGQQQANFYGSIVMSSTVPLGFSSDLGRDICVPLADIVPTVHPDNIIIGGWDINDADLAEAARRAKVLEPDLLRQISDDLAQMKPLPSVYAPDFIAGNQADRANNLIGGGKKEKAEQLAVLRQDIRQFRQDHGVDKVVILWTANTERFSKIQPGIHDTSASLLAAINNDHSEISPSTLFAVAAILESCPFINGSPQNTLVPGVIELASERNVPIGGDDFKTGQTKVKSVLADFLIQSGIKPTSIVSYNHLGNNDGKNLAEQAQFESKRITKSGVVHDMVLSNPVLYPPKPLAGAKRKTQDDPIDPVENTIEPEGPDHVIVIKYVPAVGDCKRALDEYESEIFMGGRNIISMHNSCEDSLLAAPIMLDLVLLIELFSRIQVARLGPPSNSATSNGLVDHHHPALVSSSGETIDSVSFEEFHPVSSLLSFLLKAPAVPSHAPVVNALMKQRRAIETILKAAIGLPATDDLALEHRLKAKAV